MTYDASNNLDPYAPGNYQKGQATLSPPELHAFVAKRIALGLRVCLPAKVAKVLGPQYIDAKPLLQQRLFTDAVDYPIVAGVLVAMPVGSDAAITWPLAEGDTGMLVFADRALDAYIASDGTTPVDPASERCHQLTDAVFVPGLVPNAKQTATTTDLVVRNGAAELRAKKNGTFTLANTQNEMVALLCSMASQLTGLADTLVSAQAMTALGPAPFVATTVLALQKTKLAMQDVTKRLNTLKG